MKNIFKSICLILTAAYTLTACTDNFEKYNSDPYAIKTNDPGILIQAMIPSLMYVQQNDSQMVDQMVGTLGGHYTLSNRWGGQNFDTFNASDGWNAIPYNTPFTAIYSNYFQVEKQTEGTGHYWALARVIRAAAMMRVADCYGPIPYSQVADGNFYVAYDSAEEVYAQIIEDLISSAAILSQFAAEYPGLKPMAGKDDIFDGDYALWARLANSYALRAAIRIGDQATAERLVMDGELILTNAQNASMAPGAQPNPYWLASSSWGDLRSNASLVDYMTGLNDPRLETYFTASGFDGSIIGMTPGTAGFDKNTMGNYSQPNLTTGSRLFVLLASEVAFNRAEMALRGWSAGGTAKELYEQGVRLSMEQHGIDATAVATYLSDATSTPGSHVEDPVNSRYNYTRTSTMTTAWADGASFEQNLERIITQKWIANYMMGLENWAEFRRTGYPELHPTIDNLSGGVISNNARGLRRLRYPYTEINMNKANYDQAVTLLGGADNEATDLFWAKKN